MNTHPAAPQICGHCTGTGTCPTCHGWAKTITADGYANPCPECQTPTANGHAECQHCDGTGQVTTRHRTLATSAQPQAAKP